MNYDKAKMAPGQARCPGPSTADYIHKDRVRMDEFLIEDNYRFLGDEDMPTEMYLSADYARLEERRLWTRTWQWACREEHVPNVGDYIVYDIGPFSFIIVRTEGNTIKA